MPTIEAIYNAGRWMVYCPIHGPDGAVLAVDYHSQEPGLGHSRHWTVNNEYICPVCYPGSLAELTVIKPGKQMVLDKSPDRSARRTARLTAEQDGAVYQVTFPAQREQIEAVLAERPRLMRNWDGPHEDLDFLESENQLVRAVVAEAHERGKGRHGI